MQNKYSLNLTIQKKYSKEKISHTTKKIICQVKFSIIQKKYRLNLPIRKKYRRAGFYFQFSFLKLPLTFSKLISERKLLFFLSSFGGKIK